jgi:hypothetical protein
MRVADPSLRSSLGIFFDHSTWTGLDMFRLKKCGEILVTDRIARAIKGAGFTGYRLFRIEEFDIERRAFGLSIRRFTRRHMPEPVDEAELDRIVHDAEAELERIDREQGSSLDGPAIA